MKSKKSRMKKYVIVGIAVFILLSCGLGIYIAHFELRKPLLEIYFFHLDRGRAIFIRTPHNKTILIDAGQNSSIIQELTKVLPFYRRRIDMVIVTSVLPKNAGGIADVVSRYDIGEVMEPSIMGTSTARNAFEKAVESKGLDIRKIEKGEEFIMDGVHFKSLFPDPEFKYTKSSLPELVLSVSYESAYALFLGDVSKTIQKSFHSEVEKVHLIEYAHSAGDARISADLFNQINPDFVVITKKETARAASKTKKKFDIENVDEDKVINLEKKGSVHFIWDEEKFVLKN